MRAALALAVAACGYAAPGPPHAALDAAGVPVSPPADAPPNAVSVAVSRDGQPVDGAPVYFQNADGSLVVATTTDARGNVGAQMADGGYVTVLLRAAADGVADDGVDRLATFVGVKANDVLRVDVRSPAGVTAVQYATTFTTTFPTASSYEVFSSCSDEPLALDSTGSGSLALIDCGTQTDFVIVALDDAGAPLAVADVADQPLPPGVQPPGDGFPQAALTLAPDFGAFVPATMAVQGAPATLGFFSGLQAVLSDQGQPLFATTAGATMPTGGGQITMQRPPASRHVLDSIDLVPAGDGVGEQVVYQWGPPASAYTLAAPSVLLPEYVRLPSFDGTAVNWGEAAATAHADLVRVDVTANRPIIPTGHAWHWQVVAPRGTGAPSLALPNIPFDGLFDYNPAAGDAVSIDQLTTAQVPGGYDAARPNALGALDHAFDPTAPGTLVIETVVPTPL